MTDDRFRDDIGQPSALPRIVAGRSDKEVAREHVDAILPKLEEICQLIDAAKRDGIELVFGFGWNAFGKSCVAQFRVVKDLT